MVKILVANWHALVAVSLTMAVKLVKITCHALIVKGITSMSAMADGKEGPTGETWEAPVFVLKKTGENKPARYVSNIMCCCSESHNQKCICQHRFNVLFLQYVSNIEPFHQGQWKGRLWCQGITIYRHRPKSKHIWFFKQVLNLEQLIKLPGEKIWTNLKFRTYNIVLPIETGRRNNTPVENRLRTLCQENYIEDEYHYLFKCNYFTDRRKMFIKPYFYN